MPCCVLNYVWVLGNLWFLFYEKGLYSCLLTMKNACEHLSEQMAMPMKKKASRSLHINPNSYPSCQSWKTTLCISLIVSMC